jgi:hypothetical protein
MKMWERIPRLTYRAWYYFRVGYATYLTFLLGYASTLVTVYYLAIKNVPDLLSIFPKFALFAIPATVIGGPLSVVIGWVHIKRSYLFSSEQDISVEANPYAYKLIPGIATEVGTPTFIVTLRLLRKLSEKSGILTDSERAEIENLEKKWIVLLEGGYVGTPRRSAV